jgi:glycosyltransferase involved in cell wall biosynthesis
MYLDEAVASVLNQTFADFEIVVVNDGSTDPSTICLLAGYAKPKTRVLSIENQGLASARNRGIEAASGEYILPLDADDAIAPGYLEKAVAVMDSNPDVGIVYCLGELFGAEQRMIAAPEFSVRGMLFSNLIFASALFRRADWLAAGGYNPNMRYGCEDWDFWLSLIERERRAYRIPEILFRYRIKEGSMNASMDREKRLEMHLQIMRNHPGLFIGHARPLLRIYYRVTGSRPYRVLKRLGLFSLFPAKKGNPSGSAKD